MGNAYNNQNGIFSCPHTGVYVFQWTIQTQGMYYAYAKLRVNGHGILETETNAKLRGVGNGDHSSSLAVVHLTERDTVQLYFGERRYTATDFHHSPAGKYDKFVVHLNLNLNYFKKILLRLFQ